VQSKGSTAYPHHFLSARFFKCAYGFRQRLPAGAGENYWGIK
jgi:hypothetical protein